MRKDIWLRPAMYVVLALAGGFGIWFFLPRGPHLTEENIQRIQPGMTLAEIERILGASGHEYSDHRDLFAYGNLFDYDVTTSWTTFQGSGARLPFRETILLSNVPALDVGHRLLTWKTRQVAVCIELDEGHRAIDLAYGRRITQLVGRSS